uniref:Riboflavin transporter n=1 Tax=Mesocestoides corti TaxID=53468 RepID=A0A5K3F0N9_MESCO
MSSAPGLDDFESTDVPTAVEAGDDQVANISFSWWIAILLVVFGISSWVAINGLWMELPLLVNVLPEGWNLPAYLAIIIQLANIGPLLYVLVTRIGRAFGRGHSESWLMRLVQPPERLANYTILIVGLVASLLLTQFWDAVVIMPGLPPNAVMDGGTYNALHGHSLGLFILTFALGMIDCMSSVTFLAYLANMPAVYAGALLFGETASGLLPSLFALAQGAYTEPTCIPTPTGNGTLGFVPEYSGPHFSVSTFMGLIAGTTVLSLLAFTLLDCLPTGLGRSVTLAYQKHHSLPTNNQEEEDEVSKKASKMAPTVGSATGDETTLNEVSIIAGKPPTANPESLFWIFFLLTGYSSCLTNGLLPSLQSFSTAAYSTLTYHLAVTLSGLTAPIVALILTTAYGYEQLGLCIRSIFCRGSRKSLMNQDSQSTNGEQHTVSAMASVQGNRLAVILVVISFIASIPSGYIVYLAASSPAPPALGGAGPVFAVLAWILMTAAFNVQRTWITLHLVKFGSQRNLRTLGVANQVGSATGALVSFLLTAMFRVFESKAPCV